MGIEPARRSHRPHVRGLVHCQPRQVVACCNLIIKEGLKVKWQCNSRVDYVDEEMLQLMGKAGLLDDRVGIESANEQILKRAAKGYRLEQAPRALKWAHDAGIQNTGYFIIGLPGETVETIPMIPSHLPRNSHWTLPYSTWQPPTLEHRFFFEVLENNWFRPGTQWESVDMDQSTVLDYPGLRAEELLYWQKRAFREWAFRPGPIWTYLKGISDLHTLRSAVEVGLQTLAG